VKFPAKIRQSAGGFPTWELTVTEVKANGAVDIAVPDGVRQATKPYSTVTTQMAAEGVWFLSGGTHNSAVIEMKDYLILVEAPLNDERALAVLAEARDLVANKPVRYVVNSHHHFDHAGGLRAMAGEGITVVTHDVNRAFLQKALAARATIAPDHIMATGKKPRVEGFKDRRVLTDGTRTVEIRHIGGNLHHDGLIMVYLPKEKILIEADAYSPLPPNAPVPAPANPFTVSLAENLERQKLDVDHVLPLHGRIVPVGELHKAIGHSR
jgi:glyoxylase-like metal-dependent hydrolase (beta-lactamase superfamily II)